MTQVIINVTSDAVFKALFNRLIESIQAHSHKILSEMKVVL